MSLILDKKILGMIYTRSRNLLHVFHLEHRSIFNYCFIFLINLISRKYTFYLVTTGTISFNILDNKTVHKTNI